MRVAVASLSLRAPVVGVPAPIALCAQCPWAIANHEKKPDPLRFYTKANVRRLWNQIRGGGQAQSCHLTDPRCALHVEAGCSPNATPRECAGAVMLVKRELLVIGGPKRVIDPEAIDEYKATRRNGLTTGGIQYFAVMRGVLAGLPYFGGSALPEVEVDDPRVAMPAFLGVESCPNPSLGTSRSPG